MIVKKIVDILEYIKMAEKLTGAALVLLGFLGWKWYLFAGTGFAFLICLGLVIVGIAMMFKS